MTHVVSHFKFSDKNPVSVCYPTFTEHVTFCHLKKRGNVCIMYLVERSCNVYTSTAIPRVPSHSKRALFWRSNVVSNYNTYLGLHAKCPIILSNRNESWVYRQISMKVLNTKFHGNSSGGSRADSYGQTDGDTDGQP